MFELEELVPGVVTMVVVIGLLALMVVLFNFVDIVDVALVFVGVVSTEFVVVFSANMVFILLESVLHKDSWNPGSNGSNNSSSYQSNSCEEIEAGQAVRI
uniref:Transmembrane protein n=1 Tax=Acrobeloides nanus TaxID=290746 RepID=A0A914DMM5_9BILA